MPSANQKLPTPDKIHFKLPTHVATNNVLWLSTKHWNCLICVVSTFASAVLRFLLFFKIFHYFFCLFWRCIFIYWSWYCFLSVLRLFLKINLYLKWFASVTLNKLNNLPLIFSTRNQSKACSNNRLLFTNWKRDSSADWRFYNGFAVNCRRNFFCAIKMQHRVPFQEPLRLSHCINSFRRTQ